MATEPLLNLNTLYERPLIEINGTTYELIMPDEMSIGQYVRMDKTRERFLKAWAAVAEIKDGETLDPALADELDEVLAIFLPQILPAPPEVHEQLRTHHKLRIYTVFQRLQQQDILRKLQLAKTQVERLKPLRKKTKKTKMSKKRTGVN